MQSVKVDKVELLNILKANRSTHFVAFQKAFEGYRQECIRILEKNLESLRTNKNVVVHFYEQAPQDQTKNYDIVIKMLEMSVDSEVELSIQEFQNYVNDEWNWKQAWTTSNSKYLT